MDLEKAYDRVNRGALWQVLRMYYVDGKLLSGIKSMYVDILFHVRVKEGVSFPFGSSMYKLYGCSDERGENVDGKERREWRLPGLMYANDLVLCGESEEDLRMMVRCFVEVCRRRGLKVNAVKSKVMVLNGEMGLECEVCVDRIFLEHISEFKYLVVFWTNQVQMGHSVVRRW